MRELIQSAIGSAQKQDFFDVPTVVVFAAIRLGSCFHAMRIAEAHLNNLRFPLFEFSKDHSTKN